jgi:uncharacterized lipoprotein YajG
MKTFRLILMFVAASLLFAACKTTESENTSERPWNSQAGWEHGLPTTINQGR